MDRCQVECALLRLNHPAVPTAGLAKLPTLQCGPRMDVIEPREVVRLPLCHRAVQELVPRALALWRCVRPVCGRAEQQPASLLMCPVVRLGHLQPDQRHVGQGCAADGRLQDPIEAIHRPPVRAVLGQRHAWPATVAVSLSTQHITPSGFEFKSIDAPGRTKWQQGHWLAAPVIIK